MVYDSELPIQGMWVQSLGRELRSNMPNGEGKIKKRENSRMR